MVLPTSECDLTPSGPPRQATFRHRLLSSRSPAAATPWVGTIKDSRMTMIETVHDVDSDALVQSEEHPVIEVFSEIAVRGRLGTEAVEGLMRPRNWPRPIHDVELAWVQPGDRVVVSLVNPNSDHTQYELPWGRRDLATNSLVSTRITEGSNFARACVMPFREVRMVCDVDGHVGGANRQFVTFRPVSAGFLAGCWLPEDEGFQHPCAFKVVMVHAGPDLQPFCRYEPLFLPVGLKPIWLDPALANRKYQRPAGARTFKVLDVSVGADARRA